MVMVSFLGLRIERFAQMRSLYVQGYGLPVLHETDSAISLGLADGAELHLYSGGDDWHAFFGSGPVPGLLVDDYDEVAARLSRAGVQWLGEPQVGGGRRWRHYRAPDGNVYELMGPLADAQS